LQEPGLDGSGSVIARRCKVLIVKITRIKPGQLEPEPVVATADQEIARKVLQLIRESLAREEGHDKPMTTLPVRSRMDD
jgi:hypothetical protein